MFVLGGEKILKWKDVTWNGIDSQSGKEASYPTDEDPHDVLTWSFHLGKHKSCLTSTKNDGNKC